MAPCTPTKRAQIVALHEQGKSLREIAVEVGQAKSTVGRHIRNYKKRGHLNDAPRSGRPPKLDDRARRRVLSSIRKDPRRPLADVGMDFNVSRTIIRKVAVDAGERKVPMVTIPRASERSVARRVPWSSDHNETTWQQIIFTDESSLEAGERVMMPLAGRKDGTAKGPCSLDRAPTIRSTGCTVMIWGAIMYGKKWPLVRIPKGRMKPGVSGREAVEAIVEPLLKSIVAEARKECLEEGQPRDGKRPQQDCQGASQTSPADSPCPPHLNPFDNIWFELKRGIAKLPTRATTSEELFKQAQDVWDNMPQALINTVIESTERKR